MRKSILITLLAMAAAACSLQTERLGTAVSAINGPLSAEAAARITVTRDLSGRPEPTYRDFVRIQKIDGSSLNAATAYRSPRLSAPGAEPAAKKLALVINRTLYASVSNLVARYVSDLSADGWQAIVHLADNNGKPADLKAVLQADYASYGIEGAFLVGNLPVPFFNLTNDFYGAASFPCDYYYMDLDGTWTDGNADGQFDNHGGNYLPEIWVSRLLGYNLAETGDTNEAALLNNYFEKDHAFRIGSLRLADKAFTIINKDWSSSGWQNDVSRAYTNNTSVYTPYETVTADAYRAAIREVANNRYESVLICAHSYELAHSFYSGWFYNSEVETNRAQVHFYNLFACSSARFTTPGNLAESYLLGNYYGLNVVGSAKTGSMLEFNYYYQPLSEGKTLGQAYLSWFSNTVSPDLWKMQWYYGMAMLGDPTLKLGRFMTNGGAVLSTQPRMQFRGTPNAWASTPMTLVSNYTWRAVVTFSAANTERFKFDVYGDWSLNYGDINADGVAEKNGADIYPKDGAGVYEILFNDRTLAYSVKKLVIQGNAAIWYHQVNGASTNAWYPVPSPSAELWKDGAKLYSYTVSNSPSGALSEFWGLPAGSYTVKFDNTVSGDERWMAEASFIISASETNVTARVYAARVYPRLQVNFRLVTGPYYGEDPLVGLSAGISRSGTAVTNALIRKIRHEEGMYSSDYAAIQFWNGIPDGAYTVNLDATRAGTNYKTQNTVSVSAALPVNMTVQVSATPVTSFVKILPQLYLRGTANNWGSTAMTLVADNTWQVKATFGATTTERFKFDVKGDWTQNYGDQNQDGKADLSGADIAVKAGAGNYSITLNDSTLVYTVQKEAVTNLVSTYASMNLRGTCNGWVNTPMTLVSNYTWKASATFGATATERYKFDVLGDWTQNFGDNNADGTADASGGDISIAANTSADIYFNDQTKKYWTIKK